MARRRVLDELTDDECRFVLRTLLHRHPDLVDEAEEVAAGSAANVDRDAIAEEVVDAAEALDLEDLNARAGADARATSIIPVVLDDHGKRLALELPATRPLLHLDVRGDASPRGKAKRIRDAVMDEIGRRRVTPNQA